MGLSSEQRKDWDDHISVCRVYLAFGKWPDSSTLAEVAVADHIVAMEKLLRRIGSNVTEHPDGGYYVKSLGGDVLIDQHKQIDRPVEG